MCMWQGRALQPGPVAMWQGESQVPVRVWQGRKRGKGWGGCLLSSLTCALGLPEKSTVTGMRRSSASHQQTRKARRARGPSADAAESELSPGADAAAWGMPVIVVTRTCIERVSE
jgi:hypothetical protein